MNNRHPWPIFLVNRQNWQCCLAGSSKTDPRILIFSMAMGADYSFKLIFNETCAPQFNGHNNSFLASVNNKGTWLQVQGFPLSNHQGDHPQKTFARQPIFSQPPPRCRQFFTSVQQQILLKFDPIPLINLPTFFMDGPLGQFSMVCSKGLSNFQIKLHKPVFPLVTVGFQSTNRFSENVFIFSNFSCMFLNPNNFFQFEF